jgi:ABC-type molybdate transport system substrate-binding protein
MMRVDIGLAAILIALAAVVPACHERGRAARRTFCTHPDIRAGERTQGEFHLHDAHGAAAEAVSVVGLLPSGIQLRTVYGVAVAKGSASPEAAAAFVRSLSDRAVRGVWEKAGFEAPE